ncbi:class I adenylate-forming enzyme family protein [Rhodococcus rhodochrous]|uniref:class I adenylate-forming enzyme family protein n=1 Tax=Rhodococcus rhodochrous TaxID=1829 RepID=UPI0003675A79|nr:class I adenylate-forming enzyme family protein [Rhodococcus rhodochrous]
MHQDDRVGTFPELFAEVVATRGDHIAVIAGEESLTYAELDRRSAAMASALLASGAGKGHRIGLLAPSGALWITTFCAALRIGAMITPISTLSAPQELAYIMRRSDAQTLIATRRYLSHDYADKLATAFEGLAGQQRSGFLEVLDAPYLRNVWFDDASGVGWADSVDTLMNRGSGEGAPSAALLGAVESEVVPADDALVIYTSGSTALPKAVVHTQRTIATKPRIMSGFEYFHVKPEDRTLVLPPLFWMGGVVVVLTVLATGGTMVLPNETMPEILADLIERHQVNRFIGSQSRGVIRVLEERGVDPTRILGLGTSMAKAYGLDSPKRRFPESMGYRNMGMSETFAYHHGEPLGSHIPDEEAGSVGRALPGFDAKVVSPLGEEVPAGVEGELWVRGGSLMSGFYKVERSEVFTPDGYYPTKDRVRREENGYVHFLGRLSDMIKTKGANVSRIEVAAALEKLDGVAQAIVIGLPDEAIGERIVAAVVPEDEAVLDEAVLKKELKASLSSFKIPSHIVFITSDQIPVTGTGKVNGRAFEVLMRSRLEEIGAL